MQSTFYHVIPIFLITFLGSIIKRRWLKSNEFWSGLEKLSFYILLPAVLFKNIVKNTVEFSEILDLMFSLMISLGIVAISLIIYKTKIGYDNKQFTSLFQGCIRFNNYLFLALSDALTQGRALGIASMLAPYLVIYVNILSIAVFAYYIRDENTKTKTKTLFLVIYSIIKNPVILASLIGFIFVYNEVELNIGIEKFISHLSDSGLPMSLMIIGASLKFKLINQYIPQIIYTSLIKLILFPCITYGVFYFMNLNEQERLVGILFSSMPCSTTANILSKQLKGDAETMSSIITFSTIISILTISVVLYFLI